MEKLSTEHSNKQNIMFDLYDKDDDMTVYGQDLWVDNLFHPKTPRPTIIPIPSDMMWRDVKKQLKLFFGLKK